MLLRVELLERTEKLALAPCRWTPYGRILEVGKSIFHVERICRDALATGNASIFWPALVLVGYGHVLEPAYLPAGDLGYLAMAVAMEMERKATGVVTTEDAANRLGVSARHVRRLIADGRIKARLTDSGHWHIDANSVEQLRKETRS